MVAIFMGRSFYWGPNEIGKIGLCSAGVWLAIGR
jgi:hypothetical protein